MRLKEIPKRAAWSSPLTDTRWSKSPAARRSAVMAVCVIGRTTKRVTNHTTDSTTVSRAQKPPNSTKLMCAIVSDESVMSYTVNRP